MSTDLVAETRAKLAESDKTLAEIAAGAGVSLRWLGYLKSGQAEFPHMRKLNALRIYLGLEPPTSRSKTRKSARLQRASA